MRTTKIRKPAIPVLCTLTSLIACFGITAIPVGAVELPTATPLGGG